jgi:hypothetical protein
MAMHEMREMREMRQMKDRKWLATKRSYLWAALALGVMVGAGTLVGAAVSHTFNDGDTLVAADLNGALGALDQRLTALEAKGEPLAGTFPAVLGRGSGGQYSCGAPPASLNVASAVPATNFTASQAFGDILFTNGGQFGVDLSLSGATSSCPSNICASPVTFFLKSPVDQTISIHAYVDNAGAVYLNGASQTTGSGNIISSFTVTANMPFAVSFLACSTDGPSIALTVNDQFITKYNLQVDYDSTFHRNGK